MNPTPCLIAGLPMVGTIAFSWDAGRLDFLCFRRFATGKFPGIAELGGHGAARMLSWLGYQLQSPAEPSSS